MRAPCQLHMQENTYETPFSLYIAIYAYMLHDVCTIYVSCMQHVGGKPSYIMCHCFGVFCTVSTVVHVSARMTSSRIERNPTLCATILYPKASSRSTTSPLSQ